MKSIKYYQMKELIDMIDEPNREKCKTFLKDNHETLLTARGSKINHQGWEGGYMAHITDIMNMAIVLYETLNNLRPLSFSISDALLVLFLHDIEKPWKFHLVDNKWEIKEELKDRNNVKEFAMKMINKYNFELSEEHLNALEYVEGEMGAHSKDEKVMGKLAAFCHLCDTWSARGWFDYPQKNNEGNYGW